MKESHLAEGKSKEKSLGIPSASEPALYYTSLWSGPLPSIPHWSWPPLTLDIVYYFNHSTLNIRCRGSRSIPTMAQRVSKEHQTGVRIGGCGIQRGLWVTFRGGGGLGAAFRGGVGWGVGVEGACGSVGDCWKGLRIRSTLKCLQNWEVVGVWRMLKVSEVRVGKTPRCFRSGTQVVPWQLTAVFLHVAAHLVIFVYMMSLMVSHWCCHCISEYIQDL